MKAARFLGNGRIEVIERDVPEVGEGQILVKVAYCGLCGSEKRLFRNGFDRCTPGHEMSGTVEVCGPNTTVLERGTGVVVYLSDYCGSCPACQTRNTSQCYNRRGLIGWTFDGGYAEYVVVPEHMVYPIPGLSLDLGVLALDTIGTAFHGLRQGEINSEHSVLVFGCGPIGLGCISILRNHYNVRAIYAADTSEYRCAMAEQLGAKAIRIDPSDTTGSLMAALGNRRVDRVVEVVGLDDTVLASMRCVTPGGKIVFIGEPEKALHLVRTTDWILKDFSLINSWYFPLSEMDDNLRFIKEHQAEVRKLITHYFSIEGMTEAFEVFISGETGKVLIAM
ncbi:MAG: alcohol dehydrogenase catalytic domain-containing protein [Limnochordia bacterium]|jgi:threonine 3-dehydrogenase